MKWSVSAPSPGLSVHLHLPLDVNTCSDFQVTILGYWSYQQLRSLNDCVEQSLLYLTLNQTCLGLLLEQQSLNWAIARSFVVTTSFPQEGDYSGKKVSEQLSTGVSREILLENHCAEGRICLLCLRMSDLGKDLRLVLIYLDMFAFWGSTEISNS